MKQLKYFICALIYVAVAIQAPAQQTITLNGSDITDAIVYGDTRPGYEYLNDVNSGDYPRISATAWTHSGSSTYRRGLLQFDLSSIPEGSIIESATLYFYSDPAIPNNSASRWAGNSQLSGSNAFYLEKITAGWGENTVTWNNQPATTTSGRIWVGPSTSFSENKQIDIQAFVQDWVDDPAANYGMKMILENEVYYRARNYASTDHSNTAIHPKLVITYNSSVDVSLAYKNTIESIFENVDRSYVNTGLLADYGLYFTNIEKFNGIRSDTNYIEYGEWQLLYTSLYSCKFNENASIQKSADVFDAISVAAVANNDVNLFAGLHFNYERFKDDAVSDNLVSVSNDKIYDTPGRPSTPYQMGEAFAIVPLRSVLRGGSPYSFMYKPELFYSNTSKTISSVQANFADGSGFRTLTPNTTVNINYTSSGTKTLIFRVNYTDGTSRESHTKINVEVVSGVATARYGGNNIEEFPFPRPGFHPPREYLGERAGALVTVEYTNAAREIRKPLIIVEGFDPWHILFPEDPDQNFSFEDLIDTEVGGLDWPINYTHNGTFYNTLSDALEGEDYDLIFIDFDDGTDFMQRNAYLVQNVIEWVNDQKHPYNGVMQQNVVIGFSMGGLVARYALRDMELNSVAHDTRLYASFDSPHQGANVPIGFQAMVSHLNGVGIGFGLPGIIFAPESLTFGRLAPELGRAFDVLHSPAARQMLHYQVQGSGGFLFSDNSDHLEFMNEYSDMGYPSQGGIRNIVIANGSECGTNQGFLPHAEFVNVNQGFVHIPWWGTLFSNFLSPLYVFTNYPQLIIGAPLTTRTDINAQFVVNALPNQSSNRVYYGRIYVRKKILFVINVNITISSEEFYSTPSFLPLDNAAGGIYDIGNLADLPVDVNITRFGFVPTFSALDIGGGTQTIVSADLSRPWSPTAPPAAPKNVRADNFFTNPTDAGTANEVHTQVTLRNGRWLFQEIEGQHAFFSCSYACAGTTLIPSISGATTVCANETYALQNVPAGATINWSRSGNLSYVSGQGTANYTVAANGSGSGWVRTTITGACGSFTTPQYNISVSNGAIPPSQISINGDDQVCSGSYTYWVENNSGIPILEYHWEVPTGWTITGQNNNYLYVNVGSGGFYPQTLEAFVKTACDIGWQGPWDFTVWEQSGCSGFSSAYTVSPNPAFEFIEVVEANVSDNAVIDQEAEMITENIQELRLYNNLQRLVRRVKYISPGIKIPVNDLQPGYYILHVVKREGIDRGHVVINREL